ncbi:MAG: glycosyltransferase 61 family protein [Litoreibacter sp.]
MARPAGVFTADGEYCEDAITYRAATRPTSTIPDRPDGDEIKGQIKGTILFGGLAYGHFGHAICESISRLWAMDAYKGTIDGIVYFPKKKLTWPERSLTQIQPIIETIGLSHPAIAINDPTRVERLVIAPQAFGVNDMIGGAPEFRKFMDDRLRATTVPNGPEKLYISRSEVFHKRGRFLFETQIEAYLEAEGFTIFHPQQHDLQTQLEHYKAASIIISSDNSALHLAGFVARKDCRVAILLRRPGKIYLDFQEQLRRFSGIEPVIIDHCKRYWFRDGEPTQFNEIMSLIDFKLTAEKLNSHGFISKVDWENPTQDDINTELEKLEKRTNMAFAEVFV